MAALELKKSFPFVPVALVAVLLSFTPVSDFDSFWHLRTGQLILEQQSLPQTNIFSSTFPDHPWPNPEWLFQVILAGLHGLGGWEAITVFKVAMVLSIAGLLYFSMIAGGGGPAAAASITVIALSAIQFRFTERPHLFSYLFTAAVFFIVFRHRREGGRTVWLLPVIFAFWSSIHPELVIAWILVVATLAGDWLNARVGSNGDGPSRSLVAATLLCLPAACLNPEGYHVIVFPFMHTFIGPVVEVTEYALSTPAKVPLFYLFAAALIVSFMLRRRSIDWAELLPAAAVIFLGALYQRATPYVFLVGGPILCRHLSGGRFRRAMFAGAGTRLVAPLLAALSLTWAVSMDELNTYRWGWGLDESDFPAAAADLLATGRLPGRLYHRYGMGGYLLYRLYPRVGVFQDGRLQAYPQDFIADFNARFSLEKWPALLEEHDVNTALVQRPGHVYLFRPEEWGIVNWDGGWVLLVRRTPATAELLEELEYRAFVPGVDIEAVTDENVLGVMLREMERNQEERRVRSAVTENNRAVILLRLGRGEEALDLFRRAGEMGYPTAWVNHAAVAMERGERRTAIHSLEAALELDGELGEARAHLDKIREGPAEDGR